MQFDKIEGLQMAVQLQGVEYVFRKLCLLSRHPMHTGVLRLVVSDRSAQLAGSWRFLPWTVKNQ